MMIQSYCKVNFMLRVGERGSDGYHEITSIAVPISLCDTLQLELNNTGEINITCSNPDVPLDHHNIVFRCVKAFQTAAGFSQGIELHIEKRVPLESGLGGGSSNGASVLLVINDLLRLQWSREQLMKLTQTIGSDIPFFFADSLAKMEGRGEIITPIPSSMGFHILLVKPNFGVSTKAAYELFDTLPKEKKSPSLMEEALRHQNYEEFCHCLENDLQQSAFTLHPELLQLQKELNDFGFDGVLMSGSGSCMYGITKSNFMIEAAYHFFKSKYPFTEIVRPMM